MNDYEMVYIVSPRLSSEEAERATAWVDGLIRNGGGELLSTDVWGRRRLAYPIKHQFEGTYVYSTFRLEPQATRRIESELALSENVLRHLMVRGIVEGGKPEPQSARVMAAGRPGPAARSQPSPPAETGAEAEPPTAPDDGAPGDAGPAALSDAPAEEGIPPATDDAARGDGDPASPDAPAEDAVMPEATLPAGDEEPDGAEPAAPSDAEAGSPAGSEPGAEREPAGVE